MQRSCSSPCLSKKTMVEEHDSSKVLEIVGDEGFASALKPLVSEAATAIDKGLSPESVEGGLGGAYYFKNCSKVPIAIVKPQDEEPFAPNNPNGYVGKALGQPGMKRSIRVGEACAREVAAYLLDHGGFARVPKTALVKATHAVFHMNEINHVMPPTKLCSFQQYVEHDYDASDFGTAQFPVAGVHRIGILDIRLYNTDRHAGNILVRCLRNDTQSRRKFSGLREDYCVELTPIDHGYCLPETLDSPYFEWLHWPQAALPFSDEELKYISALDVKLEVSMLRRELPMLREGCLRVLMLSTTFLQRAAAAGFTLYEIGTLMSRELRGYEEEPSEFEKLCAAALVEVRDMSEVTFDADVWSSRASSLVGQSLLEDEGEEGDATDQGEVEDSNEPIQFDMDHDDDSPGSVMSALDNDSMDISTYTGSSMSCVISSPDPRVDMVACLITEGGGSPVQVEDMLDCQYVDKEHVGAKGAGENELAPRSLAVKVPSFRGVKMGFAKKDALRRRGLQPLPQTSRSFQGSHWGGGRLAGHKVTSLQRDAQCLLQGSVDLSDLDEETWSLFLDVVVDFIDEALQRYREDRSRLSKRLGTSCKF